MKIFSTFVFALVLFCGFNVRAQIGIGTSLPNAQLDVRQRFAVYNNFAGTGGGYQNGLYNVFSNTGDGEQKGVFNTLGTGYGPRYGVYNQILGTNASG